MTDGIVALCNQALSDVGTRSMITSLTEASKEAQNCALWYDTLRARLLRTAPWGFARLTAPLSQLGDLVPDNTSPYPWLYKYAYPADCQKFRYVLCPPFLSTVAATQVPIVGATALQAPWGMPSRSNRFIVAADKDPQGNVRRVLLSNVQNAIGVYTADITDPTMFDSLFGWALESALAYKLLIPLTGNSNSKRDFKADAEDAITKARAADGNEAIPKTDHTPDWIRTREEGAYWGGFSGPGTNNWFGWGNWMGSFDDMSWGM